MKAIFTDENGRVQLVHHRPDLLSEARRAQAAMEVHDLPPKPAYDSSSQRLDLWVVDGEIQWKIVER